MDILSMLENSGVEFLVYKIIHLLELRDICSLLQVCTNWNSWDNDYLWKQELQLKKRYEEKQHLSSVLKDSDSPKKCVQTLWRLQQSWRTVDRSQTSVVLDSSVLSITCQDQQLLCALNSGELVQVDLQSGVERKRKEIHNKGVKHVSIHPVTKRLWTGSYDGEVKVWDQSWCQLTGVRIGVAVTDLCFYEDSVFISGDDTTISCYTGAAHVGVHGDRGGDLSLLWSLSMPGGEMMNCLTVWGHRLVSGSDGGLLEVRSTETGQVLSSLEGHERGCGISGLAVNHLGLWSASFDCKMALWSEGGECLCVLIGHTQPIRCLAADQFKVVSGDYRGFVMIWDIEDIQREIWQSQSKQANKKTPGGGSSKTGSSGIYRMRGRQVIQTGNATCEVLQHSSILEHHGNVTEVILIGPDVLVSSSRDRTCNIHQFSTLSQKSRKYERKSYL